MADDAGERQESDFAEQLAALDIGMFIGTTGSTLAGLAFAKIDRGDLAEAKLAIDALAALVPLLEEEPRRDLAAALANLQVAYADAASA